MLQTNESTTAPMEQEVATIRGWATYLPEVEQRLGPSFAPTESRQRVMRYLDGLLSPAERKNSWQLAEISGEPTPYGFQYLLNRAEWDADAVRAEVRTYVIRHLGDPDGVLVLDETGFVKKGRPSGRAAGAGLASMAAGPVKSQRPHGTDRLSGLCPTGHDLGRSGTSRRDSVDHRK